MEYPNTLDKPKFVFFNNVKYKIMGKGRYYLSYSTSNEGRRNAKGLHVAIWEFYSGKKVPENHQIHHIDSNTLNNDPSNLECLSFKDHLNKGRKLNKEFYIPHLNKIRHLAKDWHSSEEGIKWHSQHAKSIVRTERECKCEECGSIFKAKRKASICSGKCRDAIRGRKSLEKYVKKRVCNFCKKEYITTTRSDFYKERKACSYSCASKLRYSIQLGKLEK